MAAKTGVNMNVDGLEMKNILELVMLISMDNGIPMKPLEEIKFPEDCGFDWQELDRQASTLSPIDAEIFCCGEEREMNRLVCKTGLDTLHLCLNEIFDGFLHEYFWAA